MSKVCINELRDFCNMVCDYMETEQDTAPQINPLNGYAINYGEINWWASKHPQMCRDCMLGENELAESADSISQALYEFKMFLELERLERDVYKED